jgi:hypothetical protein
VFDSARVCLGESEKRFGNDGCGWLIVAAALLADSFRSVSHDLTCPQFHAVVFGPIFCGAGNLLFFTSRHRVARLIGINFGEQVSRESPINCLSRRKADSGVWSNQFEDAGVFMSIPVEAICPYLIQYRFD